MLASYIRRFCLASENNYEVFESYSGRAIFGRKTIGIIVKEGHSYLEMMMKLTSYLESEGFDDPLMELEGVAVDDLGLGSIVYFPAIQGYQPLQPEE